MTRSRGPTGQLTALVFVGILLLAIPAALAPTLANKAPNQEVSDAGSNVRTSMVNGTDIGTSTSPTPVPASAVATAKEEPPDLQLNTDRQELFHNRSTEALAQIAAKSNLSRELAVADETLASYQVGITEGQVGQNVNMTAKREINHQIAMQRTVIRRTDGLVDLAERDIQNDRLTRAVKLTRLGVKLQVRQVSARSNAFKPANEPLPSTQLQGYPSPSSAAFALVDRHNVTLTAEKVDDIRALDEVAEPTRSELTDVLAAYLAYENATDQAYGTTNLSKWKALMRSENPTLNSSYTKMAQESRHYVSIGSTGSLWNVRVNIGRIRGAQVRLMEETVDLQKALATDNDPGIARPASHGPLDGVRVEPVISIDLSNHSNKYTKNYAFQIDRGGDDRYNNNAGGVNHKIGLNTSQIRAAALIDLAGEDRYSGKNGGALGGSGFLLDSGTGNDIYEGGSRGANGGAIAGTGFLIDTGGTNKYVAGRVGTNGGGGPVGFGFLLSDGNGDDTFISGSKGTNGGGGGGQGVLIDAGGDDIYTAGDRGTNGGARSDAPANIEIASGYLLDAGGNDRYTAGDRGTNGGGRIGTGFLFDVNGSDSYIASGRGVNGGSTCAGFRGCPNGPSLGILLDGGGSDIYNSQGDEFVINTKGIIGLQIDLPAQSIRPDLPTPSQDQPSPTATPTPTQTRNQGVSHAEGTCDSYDGDGNGGHSEDKDGDNVYGHIQSAISASTSHSSILVHSCTYNESITVETDDLMISAVGKPILNGEGKTNGGFSIKASNVTLRGFKVRNFGGKGSVDKGSSVTIKNNIFVNTDGLYVSNSTFTHILNNTFKRKPGSDNTNGGHLSSGNIIRITESSHTVVSTNTLGNPGCCYDRGRQLGVDILGIYVDSTTDATIRGNIIEITTIGHQGEAGILIQNTRNTSVNKNVIDMNVDGLNRFGLLVYGSEDGIIRSNIITNSFQAVTVSGHACSDTSTPATCPPGIGQPSQGIVIRSNTVTESSKGITITNTRKPIVINNTLHEFSPGFKPVGIQLHGRDGRVFNATIARNRVVGSTTGVRLTGSVNTEIISNTIKSNDKGIWTGFRNDWEPYLRDFRSGELDFDQQQPTTGTVIKNNTIKWNLNGTVIDAASSPRVVSNRFIENKFAISLKQATNPSIVDVQHNHFRSNVKYSIYNGNQDEILNASTNVWVGGLPASPLNNTEENPLTDPYSGVLANGSGGPVSEGAVDGVSNVHFCAESRANCLDPPTIQNLSAVEVETADADAEFDAKWHVRDHGNNLESVELTLVDDTDNKTEDSASIDVTGGNASGTTRLVATRDDGAGHNYTVELIATDDYESTATDTVTVTETERQTPTATPTATPTPTPTPPKATNGTGGGGGTGPGGSGAGGTGGSGPRSTNGASTDAMSQERTTSDDERTVTETAPPTATDTPTKTPRLTPTPEVIPGFGVAVWLVAFALVVGVLARRRR